MQIRPAKTAELPALMAMFAHARELMSKHNNPDQWGPAWPYQSFVQQWIKDKEQFVVVRNKKIAATFAIADDYPEYNNPSLKWLNDHPYICIKCFALAGSGDVDTIKPIIQFIASKCKNIRVDTGLKNHATQYMLKKLGFVAVGTFMPTYEYPTEMIAFHKVIDVI